MDLPPNFSTGPSNSCKETLDQRTTEKHDINRKIDLFLAPVPPGKKRSEPKRREEVEKKLKDQFEMIRSLEAEMSKASRHVDSLEQQLEAAHLCYQKMRTYINDLINSVRSVPLLPLEVYKSILLLQSLRLDSHTLTADSVLPQQRSESDADNDAEKNPNSSVAPKPHHSSLAPKPHQAPSGEMSFEELFGPVLQQLQRDSQKQAHPEKVKNWRKTL